MRVKGLLVGETAKLPSNVTTPSKAYRRMSSLGSPVEGGETNRAADPGFSRIASPTAPQKKLSPRARALVLMLQQGLCSTLGFFRG